AKRRDPFSNKKGAVRFIPEPAGAEPAMEGPLKATLTRLTAWSNRPLWRRSHKSMGRVTPPHPTATPATSRPGQSRGHRVFVLCWLPTHVTLSSKKNKSRLIASCHSLNLSNLNFTNLPIAYSVYPACLHRNITTSGAAPEESHWRAARVLAAHRSYKPAEGS